jgi:hypothetical protein
MILKHRIFQALTVHSTAEVILQNNDEISFVEKLSIENDYFKRHEKLSQKIFIQNKNKNFIAYDYIEG